MTCYFCGDMVANGGGGASGDLGSVSEYRRSGSTHQVWRCAKSRDGKHHVGPEAAASVEEIEEWLDAGA